MEDYLNIKFSLAKHRSKFDVKKMIVKMKPEIDLKLAVDRRFCSSTIHGV